MNLATSCAKPKKYAPAKELFVFVCRISLCPHILGGESPQHFIRTAASKYPDSLELLQGVGFYKSLMVVSESCIAIRKIDNPVTVRILLW